MKRTILTIFLCALGMAPAFGQGRHSIAEFLEGPKGAKDTIRAVLTGVKDAEKIGHLPTQGFQVEGRLTPVRLGCAIARLRFPRRPRN